MSGFIWPSSEAFKIVLLYELYKYIYELPQQLVQTLKRYFIFGLYHTSWISCNFLVKCMFGIY